MRCAVERQDLQSRCGGKPEAMGGFGLLSRAEGTDVQLNVPPVNEAALFSIEVSPRYVFEEVNKGRLPFGCHAWKRYQYEVFWKEHILF